MQTMQTKLPNGVQAMVGILEFTIIQFQYGRHCINHQILSVRKIHQLLMLEYFRG